MPDIHYHPTFTHTDWVDNVDRIVAGGPKGFNVRLNAIESDLQQLSTVVTQVDAALDALAAAAPVPPQGEQHIVFPISLFPLIGAGGANGWFHDVFGEAHPAGGSGGGFAIQGLSLPERIKLTSFRVQGRFTSSAAIRMSVALVRASVVDITKAGDLLASMDQSTPGMTNPFDLTVPVDPTFATVDQIAFRYYVATGSGFVSNPSGASVASVQVSYLPV